ncbi:hypothetical protein ANO11243_025570 [Dothideomycetidae sp. 11243]|nr:hypothetical protein ANO11243_025570 [fungal sp. No.11243]
MNTRDFCKALLKVELHAHLTGSISRQTLHDIWQRKKDTGILHEDLTNLDPLRAIPPAAKGINVKTFFPIFDNVIYKLITTADDIVLTTKSVLDSFLEDGVVYLELRTMPRANEAAGLSKEDYLSLVLKTIAEHNASQSRLVTRLILTIDRRCTAAEADAVAELAITHKGNGVVGIDIAGNPLVGDVRTFTYAMTRARTAGLGITVHFGETPQTGSDEELYALLEMQPRRLGHVIHLSDAVRAEVCKRRLGLELCLSCNVLTEMTQGGFKGHHFGSWREAGCPIALSTDDVGIFESELGHEYEMAIEHFEVSRKQAIELSRQAASVIFGTEEDKRRIQELLDDFEVKDVVDEWEIKKLYVSLHSF